ncbi:GDP-mannose 4,6-dehydratase [Kyrpidia spormannii]|nr:GDP-mannose 4,6-dehydratase [Kyrpidia spormannii]
MDTVLVIGWGRVHGSHVVKRLVEAVRPVVVLENESTGHRETVRAVEALTGWEIPYVPGDVGDGDGVRLIVEEHRVGAVMHFAAKSVVGESVRHPEVYFAENAARGIAFFSGVVRGRGESDRAVLHGGGVRESRGVPIPEEHPVRPINPFGASKVMLEQVLGWL